MSHRTQLALAFVVFLLLQACQGIKAADQQRTWWKIDYETDPAEIEKFGSNIRTNEGPEDRAFLSLLCPKVECGDVPPAIAYVKFEKLKDGSCVADYDDQIWCPKFNDMDLVGVFPKVQ